MTSIDELIDAALAPELELARVIVERDRTTAAGPGPANTSDSTTVTVVALCGGNPGVASVPGGFTPAQLEEAVELAHERAEWKAEQHGSGPLGDALPPVGARAHAGWDPDTAAVRGDELEDLASQAIAGQPGVALTIVCAELETVVASPDGSRARDLRTLAVTRATTVSAGTCGSAAPALSALDPGLCARMAFMHGEYGLPGLPPERLPAVIGSEALAAIVDFVAADFTFTSDRTPEAGIRVAAEAVTIADLPTQAGTLARGLDADGTAAGDVQLIEAGLFGSPVGDLLAPGGGTGHSRSAFALWDPPRPANLVMAGGDAADERELAAVGDCLLIPAIRSIDRRPDGSLSAITAACERKIGGEVVFIGPIEIGLPPNGGLEAVSGLTARQDLHAIGKPDRPREWRSVLCPSALVDGVELIGEV